MALPQVIKLNPLSLTIPTTSVSVKQSFSALKMVHNETYESLTNLSLMTTENKIINLRKKTAWTSVTLQQMFSLKEIVAGA